MAKHLQTGTKLLTLMAENQTNKWKRELAEIKDNFKLTNLSKKRKDDIVSTKEEPEALKKKKSPKQRNLWKVTYMSQNKNLL